MTSRIRLIFAAAMSAAVAAPVAAQAADVLLPPYDGSAPTAKIATDNQALTALQQSGIVHIRSLGRVGDYWEGEGTLRGKPVIAYVFPSGALQIQSATPGERVRTQSAELPE